MKTEKVEDLVTWIQWAASGLFVKIIYSRKALYKCLEQKSMSLVQSNALWYTLVPAPCETTLSDKSQGLISVSRETGIIRIGLSKGSISVFKSEAPGRQWRKTLVLALSKSSISKHVTQDNQKLLSVESKYVQKKGSVCFRVIKP